MTRQALESHVDCYAEVIESRMKRMIRYLLLSAIVHVDLPMNKLAHSTVYRCDLTVAKRWRHLFVVN